MPTIQEHIDALDRMVDGRAEIAKTRSQIALISREVAALEADFESLKKAHAQLQHAHGDLKMKHAEPTRKRIEHGIEFRCEPRPGGRWQAFCPVCHAPAIEDPEEHRIYCSCLPSCRWSGAAIPGALDDIIATLRGANAA